MSRRDNGAIRQNSFTSSGLKASPEYPELSRQYRGPTFSPGRKSALYQRQNKKVVPSDVWRMNWPSSGTRGHLKAVLKREDKVDLILNDFQCADGEAGFLFVFELTALLLAYDHE